MEYHVGRGCIEIVTNQSPPMSGTALPRLATSLLVKLGNDTEAHVLVDLREGDLRNLPDGDAGSFLPPF
jgi:hypothetical protein